MVLSNAVMVLLSIHCQSSVARSLKGAYNIFRLRYGRTEFQFDDQSDIQRLYYFISAIVITGGLYSGDAECG